MAGFFPLYKPVFASDLKAQGEGWHSVHRVGASFQPRL